MVVRIGRSSTWREVVLAGLRAECADLTEEAAEIDAVIIGPSYDLMTVSQKLLLLRRHASHVWRIKALGERIKWLEL